MIGLGLYLFTNRKSHMGLNDLEQHNGGYLRYFAEVITTLGASYVIVVELRPLQQKCS